MIVLIITMLLFNISLINATNNDKKVPNFSSFHEVYDYIDSNLSEEIRKNIYLVSNGELFIKFPENKNLWDEFNKKVDTLTKLKDKINETFYFSQVLTDYLDTLGITKDYYLEIVYTGYFNHLKQNNDYNLNGFIDSISKMIWIKDSLYAANVNKDTINGSYIPKNIDDCIDDMMKLIPEDKIKEIMEYKNENDFLGLEHMGLGMFIRNQYYLWHNSRLKVYFKTLGIEHPDVISQIILTSLYRKLYNQNIKFKELIFLFRWYQKNAEEE